MTHSERFIVAAVEQLQERIVAVQTGRPSSLHPCHPAPVVDGEYGGDYLVGCELEIEGAGYVEVDIFHKREPKVGAPFDFHQCLPRPRREDDKGGAAVFQSRLKLPQPDELPLAHRAPRRLLGDKDELLSLRQLP